MNTKIMILSGANGVGKSKFLNDLSDEVQNFLIDDFLIFK